MMTDTQLKKRDEGRDIGQELLAAAQEMAAGRWARKTMQSETLVCRLEAAPWQGL